VNINNNHTSDTLNINNVNVPFVPFGNAFWDFNSYSNYEVPAGSGKTTFFTCVPWIGAIDQSNYIYSGDPNDSTTWSEQFPIANLPYDRRGVGSIEPFNLVPGAVKSIDIALVYARDTAKSNLENVTILKSTVDKIQLYYDNDSTPCGGSFTAISKPKAKSNTLSKKFIVQ